MWFTVKRFLVAVPVTKKLNERPTDLVVPFTKFALPGVGSTWIRQMISFLVVLRIRQRLLRQLLVCQSLPVISVLLPQLLLLNFCRFMQQRSSVCFIVDCITPICNFLPVGDYIEVLCTRKISAPYYTVQIRIRTRIRCLNSKRFGFGSLGFRSSPY